MKMFLLSCVNPNYALTLVQRVSPQGFENLRRRFKMPWNEDDLVYKFSLNLVCPIVLIVLNEERPHRSHAAGKGSHKIAVSIVDSSGSGAFFYAGLKRDIEALVRRTI